jgi:hypothetical protein
MGGRDWPRAATRTRCRDCWKVAIAGREALEAGVSLVEESGLSRAEARKAYSAIYAYMLGRLVLRSRLGDSARGPARRGKSNLPSMGELTSEEHMRYGYDALVRGILPPA